LWELANVGATIIYADEHGEQSSFYTVVVVIVVVSVGQGIIAYHSRYTTHTVLYFHGFEYGYGYDYCFCSYCSFTLLTVAVWLQYCLLCVTLFAHSGFRVNRFGALPSRICGIS
jgi:hypothetical protein